MGTIVFLYSINSYARKVFKKGNFKITDPYMEELDVSSMQRIRKLKYKYYHN